MSLKSSCLNYYEICTVFSVLFLFLMSWENFDLLKKLKKTNSCNKKKNNINLLKSLVNLQDKSIFNLFV